jgi:hypothetical protein
VSAMNLRVLAPRNWLVYKLCSERRNYDQYISSRKSSVGTRLETNIEKQNEKERNKECKEKSKKRERK